MWLLQCSNFYADSVATELMRWSQSFCTVLQWVSDQGSPFKNEIISILGQTYKTEHHFKLAYCPWSNETVEVVFREIMREPRAILSEYHSLREQDPTFCLFSSVNWKFFHWDASKTELPSQPSPVFCATGPSSQWSDLQEIMKWCS